MKLLPHQNEDALFLIEYDGVRGCFSGMGSGKTRTALEAANLVSIKPGRHLIIIGPPISLLMWQREAEDHLSQPSQLLKTGKTKITSAPIIICSYQIATKRKAELANLKPVVLICDESHALKSVDAKRTKELLGPQGLHKSCEYSWMLTGTPSTRWNDDLYPFLLAADPTALKHFTGGTSLERFRLRYCVTQRRTYPGARWPTDTTVGNRNTEELNSLIFPKLAVRRELKDVWEQMPPITFNHLQVPLEPSPELKEVLNELKKRTLKSLTQEMGGKEPVEGETPLSTMRRIIGRAKVKASAKEIIDRIESGNKPILVGAWHTDVIDELHRQISDTGVIAGKLDGRTQADLKQALADMFNEGKIDVLIGQIGAMGVSLNLQGGSHIIVVEADWSPAVMDQFYARCHRIGQQNHVHVDIFNADTKLDEAVNRISATKKQGHKQLMEQSDD